MKISIDGLILDSLIAIFSADSFAPVENAARETFRELIAERVAAANTTDARSALRTFPFYVKVQVKSNECETRNV